MEIELQTGRVAGDGRVWSPGDRLVVGQDVDKDEAQRLLENGSAIPVAQKRSDRAEKR